MPRDSGEPPYPRPLHLLRDGPGGEALPQVGLGIKVNGVAPSPRLGEHTEDVMHDLLAYDAARIAELRAAGAI